MGRGLKKELAEKIEYLLLHKETTNKIGEKARDQAIKLLNVGIVVKQHYLAYQRTIKSNDGF